MSTHPCKLVVHQQRHLSVMLKSMASDSPVLSYLPHAAAELILSGMPSLATFAPDLLTVLKFRAPCFLDFCTALDTMQGFDTLGLALQRDYGAFASSVATISVKCGQGGPVIPPEQSVLMCALGAVTGSSGTSVMGTPEEYFP